ncbi:MAG: FctA domain-containing protein [Candidatus Choladocola sp.]|jgi:pilin isopeptide linkage protein|nr:FctA domain-containing protein [Candidatus Choladocola sp.]
MMRMQMMRKLRCLAWFPCLLAFLLLPGSVHAKEYACDVTIPATVQVSGDRIPSGEVYEVVMEAITKDAPVAENMTQKVLNSGTVSFGQIHYTVPGDYQYKIYQKSGSTDRFTYDKTVYTVTVRVQNDAEGGLTAELWAVKEGTTMKNDAVQFQNHYDAPGNNGGGSSHHHRTEETVTYTTVIQQPPAAIGAPRTGDVQQPLLWGALILLTLSGSMIIVGKMKKYYC